jgi:DNA-binding MarR family transcriptional regulator
MIFIGKLERVYELAAFVTVKTKRAVQAVLKPHGITPDQFGTLTVLTRAGLISQTELARFLETDTTTAMVICEGLEKKGLISRGRNPTDRRTNRLAITEGGKKLLRRANAAVESALSPLVDALSSEETDRITPLLEKLAGKVKQMEATVKQRARVRRIIKEVP